MDPKSIKQLSKKLSSSEEMSDSMNVFDQVHLPKRKYYQWAILKPENKSDLAKLVAIKQVDINMPYSEASITLARELLEFLIFWHTEKSNKKRTHSKDKIGPPKCCKISRSRERFSSWLRVTRLGLLQQRKSILYWKNARAKTS